MMPRMPAMPQPQPLQFGPPQQHGGPVPGPGFHAPPAPHTQPVEPMPGRQHVMPPPGSDGLGQMQQQQPAPYGAVQQIPGVITAAGDIGAQVIAGEAAARAARQQHRMQQPETTVLGYPVSTLAKTGLPILIGGALVWLWMRR